MEATKERPLIISTQLIPVTLEGRKTQTRRVIKPQPTCHCDKPDWRGQIIDWIGYKYEGRQGWFCYTCGNGLKHIDEWSAHGILFPYGQVGDRLWLKETTWISDCGEYRCYINHASGDIVSKQAKYTDKGIHRIYGFTVRSRPDPAKKGYAFKRWFGDVDEDEHIISRVEAEFHKKQSARFMPRWASQITLEITNIRVERLQEITENDAEAEGSPEHGLNAGLLWYKQLWDSFNAKWKRVYNREFKIYEFWQFPWSEETAKPIPKNTQHPERYHCVPNPWNWVITFRRVYEGTLNNKPG